MTGHVALFIGAFVAAAIAALAHPPATAPAQIPREARSALAGERSTGCTRRPLTQKVGPPANPLRHADYDSAPTTSARCSRLQPALLAADAQGADQEPR